MLTDNEKRRRARRRVQTEIIILLAITILLFGAVTSGLSLYQQIFG